MRAQMHRPTNQSFMMNDYFVKPSAAAASRESLEFDFGFEDNNIKRASTQVKRNSSEYSRRNEQMSDENP